MSLPLIIVPVFNALQQLESCLESIARTVPDDSRVLLIDDGSTDSRVRPSLESWVKAASFASNLIVHEQNMGFVATANHGMRLAKSDVVLLNSDTLVCGDWLQRLSVCLSSDPAIATATPWSNNGEIVSIPQFCRANPEPVDGDAVAYVIAAHSAPAYPEIPTAVGFCMAISAHAIRRVGEFDEVAFGRGYGEENDFSQRAIQAGLRNVLCDDAYVVHHGGASFGPLGLRPDEMSMQRLLAKHPDYQTDIGEFIHSDPLAARRREILACLQRTGIRMR